MLNSVLTTKFIILDAINSVLKHSSIKRKQKHHNSLLKITSAVQKHSSHPVQIPNNITASLKNKHRTINGKQWEVSMVSAEYTVGQKKKKFTSFNGETPSPVSDVL